MNTGRCIFPLVACRREANERSEMVSQLLFGECYDVLEDKGDWLHIKNQRDGYESWIDSKMHTEDNPHQTYKSILTLPYQVIKSAAGLEQLLPGGSIIESVDQGYLNERQIVDTAMSYLNAPYLWGGKSIWGIDCSGFVQVVYQIHGMDIQRDAYQQAEQGLNIEFNELIEAGDLAFFSKMDEKISHVGICLGDGKIIHASGKVRIDKLDHHGIFNNETKKYSHELRLIKRIKKAV